MLNALRAGLIASAALYLAACGTTAQTTASIASVEAQVQADTNLACGFIPTIATIAALIPGVGSGVAAGTSIANVICSAISSAPVPKTASAKLRSVSTGVPVTVTTIKVNGQLVPISGTFTR
jgi:hypothetical protein